MIAKALAETSAAGVRPAGPRDLPRRRLPQRHRHCPDQAQAGSLSGRRTRRHRHGSATRRAAPLDEEAHRARAGLRSGAGPVSLGDNHSEASRTAAVLEAARTPGRSLTAASPTLGTFAERFALDRCNFAPKSINRLQAILLRRCRWHRSRFEPERRAGLAYSQYS